MLNKANNQANAEQCEAIQPQLIGYVLGEEPPDAPTRAHLLVCPRCQAQLQAYRGVTQLLPFDTIEAVPSESLRTRLLDAIAAQSVASPQPVAAPASTPRIQPRVQQRTAPHAWALWFALAAVVVALFGWNMTLQQRVDQLSSQVATSRTNWQTLVVLMNDRQLRVHQVAGMAAHGTLWSTPNGQIACLMAEDLPQLANDQVFQVWLRRGSGWVSGGTFVARGGRDWLMIRAAADLRSFSAVQVTAEPASGSTQPTSPALLEGMLVYE